MNSPEYLFNTLKDTRLPDESRTRMRAELSAYADLHTVKPAVVASPFFNSLFASRAWMAFAAIVLVIGTAGGTAYASTDALPGHPLYAIKVKVAEPVQTALIPSAKGKAAWHAILAERRLEEATTLAASDSLSTEAQAELSAGFSREVDASIAVADHLARTGDARGSLDVRSDLEARITAHERILGVVIDGTDMGAQPLLALVHERQTAVMASRLALEDSLSPRRMGKATTTPRVVALAERPRARMQAPVSAEAHIDNANAARTLEIDTIMAKNAFLLATFAAPATTTATSTATTTATTTVEVETEEKIND